MENSYPQLLSCQHSLLPSWQSLKSSLEYTFHISLPSTTTTGGLQRKRSPGFVLFAYFNALYTSQSAPPASSSPPISSIVLSVGGAQSEHQAPGQSYLHCFICNMWIKSALEPGPDSVCLVLCSTAGHSPSHLTLTAVLLQMLSYPRHNLQPSIHNSFRSLDHSESYVIFQHRLTSLLPSWIGEKLISKIILGKFTFCWN